MIAGGRGESVSRDGRGVPVKSCEHGKLLQKQSTPPFLVVKVCQHTLYGVQVVLPAPRT